MEGFQWTFYQRCAQGESCWDARDFRFLQEDGRLSFEKGREGENLKVFYKFRIILVGDSQMFQQ